MLRAPVCSRIIEQSLRRAYGLGAVLGDLSGDGKSFLVRALAYSGYEAKSERFISGKGSPSISKFANDIVSRKMAHQLSAGHIRHEAPADFHDGEARIRRRHADVGSER